MTQPPFSGNDFFDQIDSVARNLTGNAFRLKKNDPTAPQKFTEFVAQSEQEFGQQPRPQQAQPQSFTDFEQGGFQVNPAGDRRAAILAQQPSSGESAFDQSIGRGIGALGRGALGLGRTHLEALEEISPAFDLGGALFAKARPYIPGVQETEFDRQFAEASARESVEGTNPLARTFNARAFREALPSASDITIIGDPRGASNFNPTQIRSWDEIKANLVATGRALQGQGDDPLWELNLAELGAMVTDPLNLVPGLGTPSLVTKPLGAGSRVVAGAGKKALSAADEAAAAVGRTGVGNVLDPVPPQTVAGRAAGGAGDGGRTQLGFIQDNPLKKLQDEGVTEGRQFDNAQASVVGNKRLVTGSYDNIDVPVEALKGLPGSKGEESLTGLPLEEALRSRAEIVKSIRERGFDPSQRPLIGIEPNGTVNVSEGNQRIAAAAEAGP